VVVAVVVAVIAVVAVVAVAVVMVAMVVLQTVCNRMVIPHMVRTEGCERRCWRVHKLLRQGGFAQIQPAETTWIPLLQWTNECRW
jgi:hypothetical protein